MNDYTFKVIKEALIKDYKLEMRLSQIISAERDNHLNNMKCLRRDYEEILKEEFPL